MTTKRCLLITTCVIALLLLITPQLFAQTCIQDEYNSFNGTHKNLSCTANDVRVASIVNGSLNVFQGGLGNKCVQGGKFSFTATFNIVTTSSSARSNIGIFFGSGQNQALTGTCSQAIISPEHPCSGASNLTCGDADYYEADTGINGETSPTGCGDTSSNDNFGFGAGVQRATLEVDNVTCPTTASPCPAGVGNPGDTCLALPTCTGWYQPTNTMPNCSTTAPGYPWVPAAVPGTSSKCECGPVYIPVQPITPQVSVEKQCQVGNGAPNEGPCHLGAEGQNETYTVNVTNTTPAGEGGVTVTQICDDQYGTIFSTGTSTCPAGSRSGDFLSTTCDATHPGDVTTTGSCTFTVKHGENLTVSDIVHVYGTSDLVSGNNITPTASNQVTVDSTDAPTTATTTKGLQPGPVGNSCVTLRYNVTLQNTSGADEFVTLKPVASPYTPALHDNYFGDISTVTAGGSSTINASVLGTTCGVAVGQSGAGSLSGFTVVDPSTASLTPTQAPGGAYAFQIDPGKAYKCWFDGVVCGAVGPIVTTAGTCGQNGFCSSGLPNTTACTTNTQCNITCTGLQNLDTVHANLTGDDLSPADTITETDHQFTANVCMVQSGQSQ